MIPSVLMLVSEALPYSKTGGLGDVGAALPSALARLGWDVTVALPRYRGVADGVEIARFDRDSFPGCTGLRVVERRHDDGVRVWLVDCPAYFDRAGIYGEGARDYPDNAQRYALWTRAALETAARTGLAPSVVHAHDWQAGLAPAYLKYRYSNHPALGRARRVFTIHNLAYQGLFAPDALTSIDLGPDALVADGMEFWGQISLLKSGINYSDAVTTVSQRYAHEIQTPEFGCGFDGIMRHRADALTGILNGIDTALWNPERDPWLPEPFSVGDLSGKAVVKEALLARFHMRSPDHLSRPLIGMVSRMVDQKGLDLVAAAERDLLALDATYVILGTGEPKYERMWRRLSAEHPDRVAATVGFSEELAHLIEGGVDIFLMPSRFEPCGLNQMYSLRYGTVPVVRATGGLDDTVQQVDPSTGEGTGFKFASPKPEAMLRALRTALRTFRQPELWLRIQIAGMRQDHSWDKSAREYVKVYEGSR